jgi:site-specific DNA-methyltransferase (adenine-specific)
MPFERQQRIFRAKSIRVGHQPVMWFTKGPCRRNRLLVPDTIKPGKPDKELHPWQKSGAIWQWIEPLTDPGDLVVDPFCGSGEWGHICAAMGRRWIGADIADGGSVKIVA